MSPPLGYSDRNLLRDGLAMTLAKTPEEEVILLECFDRFFRQDLADFSTPETTDTADEKEATTSPADTANLQAEEVNNTQLAALERRPARTPELQIPAANSSDAKPG